MTSSRLQEAAAADYREVIDPIRAFWIRDEQQCDSIIDMAAGISSFHLLGNSAWNAAAFGFGVGLNLLILPFVVLRLGVAAALGPWVPEVVFEEIRKQVRGYAVPAPVIATGGAAQTMPVNGRIPVENRPDLVHSDHNGLFASGTLGRYSKILNSVIESRR